MKKIIFILTVPAGCVLVALICGSCCWGVTLPPPEPTPAEKNQQLLVGSAWNLKSVVVNDVDKTTIYAGLKITFSSSGYTSVSGGDIWPAVGTWVFTNDDGNSIKRDDGVEISIVDIGESKVTFATGAVHPAVGQYVLILTR